MARSLLTRVLSPLGPKLLVVAFGIISLFVLFVVTLRFGLVSGEEFAPDTFERRSYWYYELPIVHLKLSPVVRKVEQRQFEKALVKDKFVTQISPPKRWDLVAAYRGGRDWRLGDAQILCRYLDAWDSKSSNFTSYWETWTSDHPKLAKVLWPEVVTLARQDLYFLIPPLFEKALAHQQPQKLQNDLNQILARNYDVLATTEVDLANYEAAIRFYSNALKHDPRRKSSLKGRAECYEKSGKTDEASHDRQTAKELPVTRAEQEEEATGHRTDEENGNRSRKGGHEQHAARGETADEH